MDSLADAVARILERAEPVEPIEVSLLEAIGLVLAEPAIADVDSPPFDRAGASGYAVVSAEATPGVLLRVAAPCSAAEGLEIERGEAARVEPGDPMPVGADALLGLVEVRPDSVERGTPRVIEVLARAEPGGGVIRRGATLTAGTVLADAGARLHPAMLALLAAQGCVHPLCHRRVRVSILAVGEHLVGPADAPVLHHERNAGNLAVAGLILGRNAMIHDLGAVAEADFEPALDRALNAPVVLILGRIGGAMRRALAHAGVEPTVTGVALDPGGGFDVGHGVVLDDDGRVVSHVIHVPLDPIAAVVASTLLVLPLLARLQGGGATASTPLRALWDGTQPATEARTRAVPARLSTAPDGVLRAQPVVATGPADLPDLARADGLALFPPGAGPWRGGEAIGFAPFAPWPGQVEGLNDA